eukprot:4204858-Prymnesium_polylepis.1
MRGAGVRADAALGAAIARAQAGAGCAPGLDLSMAERGGLTGARRVAGRVRRRAEKPRVARRVRVRAGG